MIKIAIIDTMVDVNKFSDFSGIIYSYIVSGNQIVKKKYTNCYCHSKDSEYLLHGTVCLSIILSNILYKKNTEIYVIELLNAESLGNIEDLVTALNWCKDNEVNIISMSFGTQNYMDFIALHPLLCELSTRATLISASSNDKVLSYPAGHPNVISVESSYKNKYRVSNKKSNVVIPWRRINESFLNIDKRELVSNSYACALFSSMVINNNYLKMISNRDNLEINARENCLYISYRDNLSIIKYSTDCIIVNIYGDQIITNYNNKSFSLYNVLIVTDIFGSELLLERKISRIARMYNPSILILLSKIKIELMDSIKIYISKKLLFLNKKRIRLNR